MCQRSYSPVIVLLYASYKIPLNTPHFFIFIEKPEQSLIDELTSITHGLIKEYWRRHFQLSRHRESAFSETLEPPSIGSELLAWSVAQRANHKIIVQASIEHVPLSSLSKAVSCCSLELGDVVSDMSLPSKITNILRSSFCIHRILA